MSDEFEPFDEDEEGEFEEEFGEFLNSDPPDFEPPKGDQSFEPLDPLEGLWNPDNAPWNKKGQWRQSSTGDGAFRKESDECFSIGLPSVDGPGLNASSMLEMVLGTQVKRLDTWPALQSVMDQTVEHLKEQGLGKKPKKDPEKGKD